MVSRHSSIKSNLATYGACLLVAAILWFLNMMNKEYVTEITYPVQYGDIPRGKILAPDMPREITLEIKARGFALLRHQLTTSFLPVVFNINSDMQRESDAMEKQVNMAEIKERVSARFNSGIQLLHVEPETITLKFERVKSKKVPVAHDTRYTLQPQYALKEEISVTPDSVLVEGRAPVIDTLRVARLDRVTFTGLSGNVSRNVPFAVIPGALVLEDGARVSIEVERCTGARRSIPVVARGVPPTLRLLLFPPRVEVTYNVGLSRYDRVLDSRFVLSVDYHQVENSPATLEVKVEEAPPLITNLSLSPGRVEYLVEQK